MDESKLSEAIEVRLRSEYTQAMQKLVGELGGDPKKYRLRAPWKARELHRKAVVMARSLHATMGDIKVRVEDESPARRQRSIAYKTRQLEDLIRQEGQFQAQADALVHSGVVSQKTSHVMYFENLGPDPCDTCTAIAASNPYTIEEAARLGSAAHPNCRCAWTEQWRIDAALMANTRRQVGDGEVRLWMGTPRTPAEGRVIDKVSGMRTPSSWAQAGRNQRALVGVSP